MYITAPTPAPTPTPTPTAHHPWGAVLAKPTLAPSSGEAAVPVILPTTTPDSIIAGGQNRSAAHNALVLSQTGRKVGGSKRSRKSKRSKRSKRSRKSKRSKRSKSKRSRRSKRGGQPTPMPSPSPSPTPKPTVPVPQFAGAHNAGANGNSLSSNFVAMHANKLATYDDPNGPVSTTQVS